MAELINTSLFSDANLQAYYRLDDVNDDKNSNNLTNTGSVAFVGGKYGSCADFGATINIKNLSIASNLGYDGGAYSICGWIKFRTLTTDDNVGIFRVTNSDTDTRLDLHYDYNSGTRQIGFGRSRVGVADDYKQYTVSLGTTNWNHIAHVYNGSTCYLYVNGVNVDSVASTGSGTSAVGDIFNIGYDNDPAAYLEDVACFDRELTSAEVKQLYEDTGGGFLFNFL
uniref:Putative lectin/glucanase superfamily protein n=1 Tax=viral metagenome TaxID=1070528 RepID=A0A6M3IGI7_9ZZZZ